MNIENVEYCTQCFPFDFQVLWESVQHRLEQDNMKTLKTNFVENRLYFDLLRKIQEECYADGFSTYFHVSRHPSTKKLTYSYLEI